MSTQGGLQATDNQLDIAIDGRGYFTVTRPDGSSAYTRDGSFNLSPEGEIVTLNGDLWRQTDGTARTLTFGGNGDMLVTGSILAPTTIAHGVTKGGTGTLTLQGAAANFLGSFNVNGGTTGVSHPYSGGRDGTVDIICPAQRNRCANLFRCRIDGVQRLGLTHRPGRGRRGACPRCG